MTLHKLLRCAPAGAAAAEKLNLFRIEAVNFYHSYPPAMADPLQFFIAMVNTIGELLSAEQREKIMQELPQAFRKVSLLLTALAHED